ncbi:MAG TPA: hypothetical protein VKQ32_12300 [Polyangia bacterium]|nr:hypothetical protein [Polyangia bacterium]
MAPILLGPVIAAIAVITVGVIVGPTEPLLGGPFMNWLIGVVVFGALALAQGVCMLGFDALFTLVGGRVSARRRCAWIAGLVAPLPVAATWAAAPPGRQSGLFAVVLLFAPIVVFAGLIVWVKRKRCARGVVRRDG